MAAWSTSGRLSVSQSPFPGSPIQQPTMLSHSDPVEQNFLDLMGAVLMCCCADLLPTLHVDAQPGTAGGTELSADPLLERSCLKPSAVQQTWNAQLVAFLNDTILAHDGKLSTLFNTNVEMKHLSQSQRRRTFFRSPCSRNKADFAIGRQG